MELLKRWFSRPFRESFINEFIASGFWRNKHRTLIYELYGIKVGTNSEIGPRCRFSSSQLIIGNNSSFSHAVIDNTALITIGDNCRIAPGVSFICSGHNIGNKGFRAGDPKYLPITINNGCWIGAGVMLLGGITLGSGCVVAAGAVVTKDCEPNGLYAGVPARRIKDLQ